MSRVLSFIFFFAVGIVRGAEIITPDDPASVQRGIDAAYKSGAGKITIPPGVYRMPPGAGSGWFLRCEGMKNFEIDAAGVTFVLSGRPQPGFLFERCENVTYRGATQLHDPVPFSQGTIEAMAADRRSAEVRIHTGYPADLDDSRYFEPKLTLYVFDPKTRQWKGDTHDIGVQSLERLGPDRFRFHFVPFDADEPIGAGDLLAWRGKGGTDVSIANCARMRVEDVTIRSGGGFCIHEAGGAGGNYYRYKVTYGAKPPGASESPLIACNADAFHSSDVREGPTLERCLFEGMPDDGVPIHGHYAMVQEAAGRTVVVNTLGGPYFQPGDGFRLLGNDFGAGGEAKVTAIRPLPDYRAAQPPNLPRFKDPAQAHFYELTLDRALPAQFENLAANPNACGSGFIVRGCTVRNHRARGMLIKADHGLIEDCTVEGSTMGGIVLSPELYWNEADYSHSITVRRNVIRAVGTWRQPWNPMAGALTIAAHEHGQYVAAPGHQGIVVEDNTFEDQDGVNILVSSARDVTIRGNRFVRPLRRPVNRGAQAGVEAGALIWLTRCADVRLENNTVSDAGPELKKMIGVKDAANVTGAADGVSRR